MLLKNGYIVEAQGGKRLDIRIEDEIISEIDDHLLPRKGEEVIDIAGKVVLPGGVDVHTHMETNLSNERSTDDFYTGTVAAACGGTTTIIDHMLIAPQGRSILQYFREHRSLADGKAVIDYGFHGIVDHVDDDLLSELEAAVSEGITSHQIRITGDSRISDQELLPLMERADQLGVLLCVHAENESIITHMEKRHRRAGHTAPIYHARCRPPECEAEAIAHLLHFARMLGDVPLYILHLSSELSLNCVRVARWWRQHHLFVETCPQYLFLNEDRYRGPDGLKYITSPPLRPASDSENIQRGIVEGDIDIVATDHRPFFYTREKQLGKKDYARTPGGLPGVETRMALLFSEVSSGRLSFPRMVELCCTTPARLFGLYPKKGVIAVGSDADLVLFDPNRTVHLSHEHLHENTDYTPYEGMVLHGWPVMTFSRGEVIVDGGRFVGQKGRGRFLWRGMPDLDVRNNRVAEPLENPV